MEDDCPDPAGHEPSRKRGRFAWGIVLGIALGSLAVVLILSIAALLIYFDWRARFDPYTNTSPSNVTYVQSSEPWVQMVDDNHGQVVGFANGGWGSGSDMGRGAIADFGLSTITRQDNVPARIFTRILVTPKTELTLQGKPWKPKGSDRDKSPAEMLFSSEMDDDSSFEFLQERELTVRFRLEGDALIAESIDASAVVNLPEGMLDY